LMTSCHVSEKLKRGPVIPQVRITRTAIKKAHGVPVAVAAPKLTVGIETYPWAREFADQAVAKGKRGATGNDDSGSTSCHSNSHYLPVCHIYLSSNSPAKYVAIIRTCWLCLV
jgi:hypothetical protein